jgi:hypothetical protein
VYSRDKGRGKSRERGGGEGSQPRPDREEGASLTVSMSASRRYPHRNAQHKRESTPEELEWLASPDLPGWARSQLPK